MIPLKDIAWIIPCYNEELTIAKVISDIKREAPQTRICVFDNNSSDQTASIAATGGAEVYKVLNKGKGNVVRRMFELIDAQAYILIDGDDTYEVADWKRLADPVLSGEADMVVGSRLSAPETATFRRFHSFGNRFITGLLNVAFGRSFNDVLSGYRVFSKHFAKGVAIDAKKFEIEVNLTILALENRFSVIEVPTRLRARPEGSFSKLRTFQDGFLISYSILKLFKDYKPLTFFGFGSFLLALAGLFEYFQNERFGFFLFVTATLSLATGLILNAISQRAKELMQIIGKLDGQNRTEKSLNSRVEKT